MHPPPTGQRRRISTDEIFTAVVTYIAQHYPGFSAVKLSVDLVPLLGGQPIRIDHSLPIRLDEPTPAEEPAEEPPNRVPLDVEELTDFQLRIMEALEGKALHVRPLGSAVGDEGRLYKKNGIRELRAAGLVVLDERHGYYRPDAPPPALAAAEDSADLDDYELRPFQLAILEALEGKALKTRSLASALQCEQSRLYKPHGLTELRKLGLVAYRDGYGFYRPDAPPPGLAGKNGAGEGRS